MPDRPRKWEKAFLAALEETGNISQAAEAAKIGRQTVYDYQRNNLEFAHKCADAVYTAADIILAEMTRRAVRGEQVPVYYRGRLVGYRSRPNDTLLMFVHETLLKQSERILHRARTQQPAPPAVHPLLKPPIKIVGNHHHDVEPPLRKRPATEAGRAA